MTLLLDRGSCDYCRTLRARATTAPGDLGLRCSARASVLLFPRHHPDLDHLPAHERDRRVGPVDVIREVAPLFDRESVVAKPCAAALGRTFHRPLHFAERLADADAVDVPLVP